ncbi:LisH domain-containing protein ARMC9 [Hondaea fermentalgiana]|uniref:LisH domain-containing protein ARMC9 n=1 Tax=Hondaea fermentalgiana TaxID=2315210 RepID=A0A2R5GBQ9_9STRA|nr:LisH domain-containing protein ARMC9 [Hondaea fermentalgiana]|eukprot:GBG28422.1 LisH domain-containing protein ARMC9 [Hondaea fermentalgiana]
MSSAAPPTEVDPARVQRAILEYLKHYEFVHSAECLEAELERRRLSAEGTAGSRRRRDGKKGRARGGNPAREELSVAERILCAFDAGNEDVFVFLWNTKIDERDRDVDLARHIEFDTRLYLAAYYVLDEGTSAQLETDARMRALKKFLDTRGRALASDPACCAYYALPLCAAPQEHSVFSRIFEDSWRAELRARLEAFLQLNAREGTRPELCELYAGNTTLADGNSKPHTNPHSAESKLDAHVPREVDTAQSSGRENAKALCKAIYATTVQTVELLQRVRNLGGPKVQSAVSERYMNKLMRKMQRFADLIEGDPEVAAAAELDGSFMSLFDDEDIAEKTIPSASAEQRSRRETNNDLRIDDPDDNSDDDIGASMLESKHREKTLVPAKPTTAAMSPQSPHMELDFQAAIECPVLAPLDYGLIKSDLDQLADRAANEPMAARQACLVLQALRWRLSRTPSALRRASVLAKYAEHDILGIAVDDGERVLLKALLTCGVASVREYAVRLISYVAMGRAGRVYLLAGKDLVLAAIWEELSQARWKFPRADQRFEKAGNPEIALCALQRLSLHPSFAAELHTIPEGARVTSTSSTVAFLVNLLQKARHRTDFVNEHIAALALNLSISSGASAKLEQEEDCLRTLEAILSEEQFGYLHEFAVAILYAMLRGDTIRKALTNREGPHFSLLQDLVQQEAESPVSLEIRQQLMYIVDLVENDAVEQAMDAEEKQALSLEKEAKGADRAAEENDEQMPIAEPGANEVESGEDLPPEDDESELRDFRESSAPSGTRQGEHLLVFAYSQFYRSPSKPKANAAAEPRSPILKLVDSLRLPDELASKPRLINTPGSSMNAPFDLGNDKASSSK